MSNEGQSKVPLILSSVSVCLFLIAGLGTGGYFYYKKTSATTTTPTTTNTPSSAAQQSGGTTNTVTPETTSTTPAAATQPLTTTPASQTPLTTVTPTLTAQQRTVYGFTPAVLIDNGGNDIQCWQDGSDANVIREKCASDNTCVGYVVVAPHGSADWKKGGGCTKNALSNITAGVATTLYAAPGALPNPDVMSWPRKVNTDYQGSDIKCWTNGEPLTVAQAACARDPACGGIALVSASNGINFNGACTKTALDLTKTSSNSAVTLYYKP